MWQRDQLLRPRRCCRHWTIFALESLKLSITSAGAAKRDQDGNSLFKTTEGKSCIQSAFHTRRKRKTDPAGTENEQQPALPHGMGLSPSPPYLTGASPTSALGTSLTLGGKIAQNPHRHWVEACLFQQPPPPDIRFLLKAEINSAPHIHLYFSFHLALCTCTKAIK